MQQEGVGAQSQLSETSVCCTACCTKLQQGGRHTPLKRTPGSPLQAVVVLPAAGPPPAARGLRPCPSAWCCWQTAQSPAAPDRQNTTPHRGRWQHSQSRQAREEQQGQTDTDLPRRHREPCDTLCQESGLRRKRCQPEAQGLSSYLLAHVVSHPPGLGLCLAPAHSCRTALHAQPRRCAAQPAPDPAQSTTHQHLLIRGEAGGG